MVVALTTIDLRFIKDTHLVIYNYHIPSSNTYILDRNCENENRRQTYKAAKLIGRQEGSEVWILDENTQIDGKGEIVPEEDQEFVWIDDLFDDKVKTQEVIYPFKTDILNDVLRALKETLHTNFMASLVAVGKFEK